MNAFVARTAAKLAGETGKLLEVGPQDRSTVRENFSNFNVDTFDIVDTYSPTLVGDITKVNTAIADSAYPQA
ncbi:MAG: hypothetical protein NTY28_04940 [Janthinobacterium sp.]|nr:hypothetical protein [Janthinobacterium sp.]